MKLAMVVGILAAGGLAAQTTGKTFEVASIKRAPPPDPTNGFRTGCFPAPGAYNCSNATVALMAFQAYGLKQYQLPNANDDPDKFNVSARAPAGATPDDLREMLRNLLAERFKLAFHYDRKEQAAYELVAAKGGVKLAEPADLAEPAPRPAPGAKDADGFPLYGTPPGSISMARANGLVRLTGTAVRMGSLATFLTSVLHMPVTDATGLQGKYQLRMTFTQESIGQAVPNSEPVAGQTVFGALTEDLGLKLEPRKSMIDMFVIDHVDKSNYEN